ncbi:MAG: NTP transferase domain-containing protein [Nitrososphaera sp.]
MCGGRGTRMGGNTEKPLVSVGGSPLVERVVNALRNSHRFERIVAAVSPNAPATREFVRSIGVQVLETPGAGYSQDLSVLLIGLRPSRVLVISADMPLVSGQIIGEVASIEQTKPLLSIILTKEFVDTIGITPSVPFRHHKVDYCQSGISVFDTSRHSGGAVEEEYVVMDRTEIALNVNTRKELELAEKLLVQRA